MGRTLILVALSSWPWACSSRAIWAVRHRAKRRSRPSPPRLSEARRSDRDVR